MTIEEIILDIHTLRDDLVAFERKYGILSETFYESYTKGEEPEDDNWVLDWAEWAGTYEIWLKRHEQYRQTIRRMHQEPQPIMNIISRAARHESIPALA